MNRVFLVLAILGGVLFGAGAYVPQAQAGAAGDRGPVRYGLGGKISLQPPPGDWNATPTACLSTVMQVFNWTGFPAFASDVCASAGVGGANETPIAADPTRPSVFLAGANSTGGTGHFVTTNGGLSWSGGAFSGIGDPAVVYDASGNAYFAELTSYACPDPVRVHKSTDGGVTWSGNVIALTDPSPSDHFVDKEWLAADTWSGSPYYGRIYLAATIYYAPACNLNAYINDREVLTYSSDGGATWSTPVTVSDPAHDQNQFVNPVVAPNGRVYMGFQYENCTYSCNNVPASNLIVHSDDGGVTWTPPITITGAPISYTGASINGYQMLYASSTSTGFRHNDQAILGVSPADASTVYAVWTDGRWDSTFVYQSVTGGHADIAFSRSTDGGATWTPPVRLNDDAQGNGRDQYFPWMAVGPDGALHVSWSDRRDGNGFQYGVYYTQSTDGGLTWAANRKVSDVLSTPGSFMGDYQGIAVNADNTLVLPIWTDMRSGQQAYFDRGLLRAAHPVFLPLGWFFNVP